MNRELFGNLNETISSNNEAMNEVVNGGDQVRRVVPAHSEPDDDADADPLESSDPIPGPVPTSHFYLGMPPPYDTKYEVPADRYPALSPTRSTDPAPSVDVNICQWTMFPQLSY